MKLFRRCLGLGLAVASGALLAGCLFHHNQSDEPTFSDSPGMSGTTATNAFDSIAETMRFKVGDQLTVTLTGPPDPIPPHQERIKEDGTITLIYIGSVIATNKTAGALQKEILDLYVPKYYQHLTVVVSADLQLYFFSVGGEVRQEGPKPYPGETRVTTAIQAAGGFTEYANRKKVQLTRSGAKKPIVVNWYDAQSDKGKDPQVFPGDKIYVPKKIW